MLRRMIASFLLLALSATGAGAQSGASLVERSLAGDPLPEQTDATALSQRFLEWSYLGAWARSRLTAGDSEEPSLRWARLRMLRVAGAADDEAEGQRRSRGLCVLEEIDPAGPYLLALCDSLAAGRYGPTTLLIEGMLQGYLLRSYGRPGCGASGDPAGRLAALLPDPPRLGLEALKSGMDFPSLYFAAEREIARMGRERMAPVRDFLSQSGLLITLRYGFRRRFDLSSPLPPRKVDAEHFLYPGGLTVDWGDGRRLHARDVGVLHSSGEHQFRLVEPGGELRLERDGEKFGAEFGEFSLDGEYRFVTDHISIDASSGRYRREGNELELWWPSSILDANRGGFLFSILIIAVTAYLLLLGRRRRHELQSAPPAGRRPRV